MHIIYRSVKRKIDQAIDKAQNNSLELSRIELTNDEMNKFLKETHYDYAVSRYETFMTEYRDVTIVCG